MPCSTGTTPRSRRQTAATRQDLLRRDVFSDPRLGPVARNIVKMWYVGIWYELPRAWTEAYGALRKNVTFTVSPTAYTEGLLWPAIGANPPGAKAPGLRLLGRAAAHPRRPMHHDTTRRTRDRSRAIRPRQGAAGGDPDPVVERRLPQHRHRHLLRAVHQRDGAGRLRGLQRRPQVPHRHHRAARRRWRCAGLVVEEPWTSTYFTIKAMEEHDAAQLPRVAGVHQGRGRHGDGRRRARRVGAPAAGGGVRQQADLRRRAVGRALPRAQPHRQDRRRRGDAAVLPPPHGHRRDDPGGDRPADGRHRSRARCTSAWTPDTRRSPASTRSTSSRTYADRIGHVHLKDIRPEVVAIGARGVAVVPAGRRGRRVHRARRRLDRLRADPPGAWPTAASRAG